jgi:hypothetical protein
MRVYFPSFKKKEKKLQKYPYSKSPIFNFFSWVSTVFSNAGLFDKRVWDWDLLFGVALCSQITILPSAHKTQTFSPPICRTHPSTLSSSCQPNRNQENQLSHQRSTTNLNPQQGKNQICGSHNPVDVGSMGYRGNQKKERERERGETDRQRLKIGIEIGIKTGTENLQIPGITLQESKICTASSHPIRDHAPPEIHLRQRFPVVLLHRA